MLRGLATANFYADDLEEVKTWYGAVLGIEAYYAFPPEGEPAYIEFRVGDYEHELGFVDKRFAPPGAAASAGAIAYWHVDDLQAALDRLLELGATLHLPITHHGEESGFSTASVIDPFGNILGIMCNPHYVDILNRSRHT
ncbi:glyoxalase [Nocardia neocaledoniensis NBRC 108232]|uniref:Putative enzyme related to lactoylglutathione lyase n=1 Tax=Nocardia neocaledoniensis TaxID=236511 RepID=A0A317NGJ1_9NOCA|nr:VOC family protein [Nocardia neocaledoniensis]PWV74516.1 putative enzyme related to lactoylglutathione lyase [Nocardia neocaledoniensis]GEM33157.1 glyoxalase [Nocardia neocaledoniensis NBRC 108232]